MRTLIFVGAALMATACGAPSQPAQPTQSAQEPARVEVSDPWAAPTPGGVDVSGGFLTISNATGEDERLIAAASPRAARVEIHEMAMDGAVMRMRQVGALDIPAGETVALAPGGMHLMFFGVSQPFTEGESIPVTLTFERAGEVEVTLSVRRRAAHEMQ